MLGLHLVLMTLHHGLQIVPSKTIRSGDTNIIFRVVLMSGVSRDVLLQGHYFSVSFIIYYHVIFFKK